MTFDIKPFFSHYCGALCQYRSTFVRCIILQCEALKEYVLIVATPSAHMLRAAGRKLWVLLELRIELLQLVC